MLAIKGLGGYHLAADATSETATALLRARKRREHRPFALMVPTLEHARSLCHVDATAERLLTGPPSPIVLLDRRPSIPVAEAVAPGNRQLGLMLHANGWPGSPTRSSSTTDRFTSAPTTR